MPESDTSFLSARVPASLKNRFKSIAARRGMKLQELLNELVEDYVEGEERDRRIATEIIRQLREHKPELRRLGIQRLSLFGSVARGESQPDSDIDLAYELQPGMNPSLFDIGRIQQAIAHILGTGRHVDLVPRRKMHDHVTDTAAIDEIGIF